MIETDVSDIRCTLKDTKGSLKLSLAICRPSYRLSTKAYICLILLLHHLCFIIYTMDFLILRKIDTERSKLNHWAHCSTSTHITLIKRSLFQVT